MRRRYLDSRPYIRRIEHIFFNENAIRRAVNEARLDRKTPEVRNGSGLPDPTVAEALRLVTPVEKVLIGGKDVCRAIKNSDNGSGEVVEFERIELVGAEEIQRPEDWLLVIDKTYTWCKQQKGKHYEVARRRYSGEGYVKICMDLFISQHVFSALLEKIKMYALVQAVQLGLVQVD